MGNFQAVLGCERWRRPLLLLQFCVILANKLLHWNAIGVYTRAEGQADAFGCKGNFLPPCKSLSKPMARSLWPQGMRRQQLTPRGEHNLAKEVLASQGVKMKQ